jgi:hypothetical protein
MDKIGYHRRHHDDEIVDNVTVETVPRWKTSGLSGDEWRVSYVVRLWRKGDVLHQRAFARMRDACAYIPHAFACAPCWPDEEFPTLWDQHLKGEHLICTQVGCDAPATTRLRLSKTFSPNGEGPLPAHSTYWRGFCDKHRGRGDCGREDADRNYTEVKP